jgi:polyisoprenoid-binding protein YceI
MGTIFLDVERHPEAAFAITEIEGDGKPLSYGRMSLASVEGTFRLKGQTVPLHMTLEMEPVLDGDQQPMLLARGMFDIDLVRFGIEGADGPAPANRTLVFDLFLPFRASAAADGEGPGTAPWAADPGSNQKW